MRNKQVTSNISVYGSHMLGVVKLEVFPSSDGKSCTFYHLTLLGFFIVGVSIPKFMSDGHEWVKSKFSSRRKGVELDWSLFDNGEYQDFRAGEYSSVLGVSREYWIRETVNGRFVVSVHTFRPIEDGVASLRPRLFNMYLTVAAAKKAAAIIATNHKLEDERAINQQSLH